MKAEFTGLGSRDFRQRYNGSWGWYTVPESGKRMLVLMDLVSDHEARFRDQKNNRYMAYADTGVVFEFIPVTKRLFIHNSRLLLQTRVPAHMWSRGINLQNTQQLDVAANVPQAIGFDSIVSAMEPEGYKEVGNIKLLNNVFGIVGTFVYVYDKYIGEWNPNTNCITLKDNMFIQELTDLVRKLNKPWSVVC